MDFFDSFDRLRRAPLWVHRAVLAFTIALFGSCASRLSAGPDQPVVSHIDRDPAPGR
ncbi:MAG: hypothetical protein NVS1B4_20140 [Gemmatimonadaceae bacterium]